jgi:hypothetical protein
MTFLLLQPQYESNHVLLSTVVKKEWSFTPCWKNNTTTYLDIYNQMFLSFLPQEKDWWESVVSMPFYST